MASPWTLEQIDQLEQMGKLSPETANAARLKLTPEQSQAVANYVSTNPVHARTEQLKQEVQNDPFVGSLTGQGTFRDTGRKSGGLGESVDSVLGVPARVALNEVAKGNYAGAIPAAIKSAGTDPRNQATGHDVAVNAGISDKGVKTTADDALAAASRTPGLFGTLSSAVRAILPKKYAETEFEPSPADVVGTAIDFGAQVPVGTMAKVGSKLPGVVGAVRKVAPELKEAQAILSKIDTPEKAVALKGAAKEEYMNALDQVYGPREQRAKKMGFGEKTWYHGTDQNIHAFDPDQATTEGIAGFATRDKEMANEFATQWASSPQGQNVMPLRLKKGRVFDAEKAEHMDQLDDVPDNLREDIQSLAEDGMDNWEEVERIVDPIRETNADYIAVREGGRKNLAALEPNQFRSTNAAFDPRFSDSPLLLAAKTGISSIDDFNAISKAQQARKKVSRAGTLAQEGYTFGRKLTDNGVEVTAKWKGKEVGKAVITKTGVSSTQVSPLHKGAGIEEELVNFGQGATDLFAGKAGVAGEAKDMKKISQAEALLQSIDTPEKAAALKGSEREQYLKALDEVYGSREQRAKGMGFGDDVYYHGTTADIQAFDPAKNKNAALGQGTYFTHNPNTASDYANHRMNNLEKMKPLIEDRKSGKLSPEQFDDLADEGGNVVPVRLGGSMGFSDSIDSQPSTDNIFFTSDKITLNKNPSTIRSTNAAFDPRFKDSANLLAAKAGPAPLIRLPQTDEEEDHFLEHALDNGDMDSLDYYVDALLNRTSLQNKR